MSEQLNKETSKILFAGDCCARRPISVVVATIFTILGISMAAIWVPQIITVGANHIAQSLCALVFIAAFLGFGIWLLRKVIANERTQMAITSEGISYGALFCHWDDIKEIGIWEKYWRRKDLYCVKRLNEEHDVFIELNLTAGLNPKQIRAVMCVLKSNVLPSHPNVRLIAMEGH